MDTKNQINHDEENPDMLLLKYEQLGDKSRELAILAILFLAAKSIKQPPQERTVLMRHALQKLRNLCLAQIAHFGEEVQGIILQYIHQCEKETNIP